MKLTIGNSQKNAQVVELNPMKTKILHYDLDYDSAHPEETLRGFVGSIRDMVSRYEYNKDRIIAIEQELVDIYHYIEISPFKNVPEGYRLYRRLAELRRERRACKNENDLLQPIYEHFHATEVLNKLTLVQGEVAKCKGAIDARTYLVRTDALDEWLNPPEEPKTIIPKPKDEPDPEPAEADAAEDIPEIDDLPVLQGPISDKSQKVFKQVWKVGC